jgi:diguanylate cyclase (GGDEF)-like protein
MASLVGSLTSGPSRFEVTRATSAKEAGDLLAEQQFDAVVFEAPDTAIALDGVRLFHRFHSSVPLVVILAESTPEVEIELKREGARDVLTSMCLTCDSDSVLRRVLGHLIENRRLVRELERARQLGLHLAHHDTLTGLPNRQLFRTRLREALARARRHPRPLAVFFIDLDRFKKINDTLGHNIGDLLLIEVGRRIRTCLRETDLVARRGGDEFTVILDGVANGQAAARAAGKILEALAEPLVLDGNTLRVGASIGISLAPADGHDVETLVRCADIAMYRAKARGGGFEFFLPEMGQRTIKWIDLENDLRRAIDRSEFVLHYQPILNVERGNLSCLEALVRWQHPERGLIFPDEFIGLAEESGLITALGEQVLLMACKQNKEWQNAGLPIVPVAVNFSAKQFQVGRPVDLVRSVLDETGLSPDFLDIELTESAVMADPSFATETLRRMRDLGLRIAIDDFGTGHSSLAYLKRFPITKLKIDKAFVGAVMRDPKDAAITRAIISMAHNLQLKAVAEGVETREQLEFLRHPGCDEVQGYLLARPQAPQHIENLLRGESPLTAAPVLN